MMTSAERRYANAAEAGWSG